MSGLNRLLSLLDDVAINLAAVRFQACPRKNQRNIVALVLYLTFAACSERAPVGPTNESTTYDCVTEECSLPDATTAKLAEQYLGNREFRRNVLEESLLVTDNTYAQARLRNYAMPNGWDVLPEYNPPVTELRVDGSGVMKPGEFAPVFERESSVASVSWSVEQWEELGKRAFYFYPAQRATLREDELSEGGRLAAAGFWQSNTGRVGGLTRVAYEDGTTGIALTCSSCHSRTNAAGVMLDGLPSDINLTAFSTDLDWGAGKVDVTDDAVDNPVAIADLRATRTQRRLHHSGNVGNGLDALAVRIETLLITNLSAAVRPPREVALALAIYIWRLGEWQRDLSLGRSTAAHTSARGATTFNQRCRSCHSGEWGEGEWVAVSAVGTDPLVARSSARGTGGYRVPTLVGFANRRLSHEGRSDGIEAWLDGAEIRLDGPSLGHAEATTGSPLSVGERTALVEFLYAAF